MDLLERYLAAVRRHLPAKDAADIAAELREALLERAEAREEALGRPLGKEEWDALLVAFGHPLTVAARYRKQQWLIGPELYPFYLHFLKMIGAIVAVVLVVTAAIGGMTHAGPPGPWIAGTLGSLWWSAAGTVGTVTIVFVAIERYGGVARHFRHWSTAELPELPELARKQPSVWESVFEVSLGIAFILWWIGALPLPWYTGGSEFRLEPAPVWAELFWPILALATARLAHDLVHWLRPRWKWLRGLLGIGTAVGGIALAAIVYQAGRLLTVVPLAMAPEQAAKLQQSLDLALGIAVLAVGVIWTLQCLGELWRFVREGR